MDQANGYRRRPRVPLAGLKLPQWAAGLLLGGAVCAPLAAPGASDALPSPAALAGNKELTQAYLAPQVRSPYLAVIMAPVASGPPQSIPTAPSPIAQASAKQIAPAAPATSEPVRMLPPPTPLAPGAPPDPLVLPNHVVPISLDTVLRLAEEQNAQVALARERVRQAYAERDVAKSLWLPDLYVGTAFYRHEGGIQNEDGTLTRSSFGALFSGLEIDGKLDIREVAYLQVQAQRQVWQQKGELSRVTSETLLEAANTYLDFLTVRTGDVVVDDLAKKLTDLLERAQKLAAVDKQARVEVYRIQAELDAQQQAKTKLRSQALGAAAKLIYLLQLDPGAELVPVDRRLTAIELVDASPPPADLVAQALTTGPGIRELQGLLNLIQESIERSKGASQYLPIFEVRMAEGGFGAGPGDRLDWANRWDLGLQARWNLTGLATRKDRRRVALAKIQQAQLTYDDLRGKLTAGVQEARESSLAGRDQINLGAAQVRDARQAYELGHERLALNPQPTSYSELLLAIEALARAQQNYLGAVNAYDKAQLRLMLLLGPAACKGVDGHPPQ
jgi:outer membrane protein TolC